MDLPGVDEPPDVADVAVTRSPPPDAAQRHATELPAALGDPEVVDVLDEIAAGDEANPMAATLRGRNIPDAQTGHLAVPADDDVPRMLVARLATLASSSLSPTKFVTRIRGGNDCPPLSRTMRPILRGKDRRRWPGA